MPQRMSQEFPSQNKTPEISSSNKTRLLDKELFEAGLDMIDHIIAQKSSISTQEQGWTSSAIRQTEAFINTIAKHENIMKKLLASQGIEVSLEKIGRKLYESPTGLRPGFHFKRASLAKLSLGTPPSHELTLGDLIRD